MSALQTYLEQCGGEAMPFGPADDSAVAVMQSFGEYEAEYAAIHAHVAVMHMPWRTVLRFSGQDRQDFLHRMTTQQINALKGGSTIRTFQLNEKGRIVADALIHHGDEDTWMELDCFDVDATRALLERRLFSEDVTIAPLTSARTLLAVMGPSAEALLRAVSDAPLIDEALVPGTHQVMRIGGKPVSFYRWDDTTSPGYRLFVPEDAAVDILKKLLDAAGFEVGSERDADYAARRRESLRGRPVGWLAYNTARIEAGTALFHIDFGTDSLPHEAGPRIMQQTVSFTKGCYLGQEIVARMHNLGHPKRVIVTLKADDDAMPVAGSQVLDCKDGEITQEVVGAITSSTVSPVQGRCAIALATVKWGKHQPGTKLGVPAEGANRLMTVADPNF